MKKILLIEDDQSIAEVIQLILTGNGYQVVHDETGNSLRKMTDTKFDLVLMDYLLPHTTGAELIKKLKTISSFKNVPVILMSANTEGELSKISAEVKADDYLPKPFDIQVLSEKVQELIGH